MLASTMQIKTVFRALCVACAMAGAVVAGELSAEERHMAEEPFLKAMMIPVRAQIQSSLDTKEEPFAPDHWLSRVKPPAEPMKMPARDPHAESHEFGVVGFGEPSLLVSPLPGHKIKRTEDYRPLMTGEKTNWLIQGPRGVSIVVFSSGVDMIPLELPKEPIAELQRLDRRIGTDHTSQVIKELERHRKMDKFDLLRSIVGLDAQSFGPDKPFHARVVNAMLFAYKHLFVPGEGSPVGYYEGDNVRCLLWGPDKYIMERVGKDGKTKEHREERLLAEVAVRGCGQVLSLWWTGEQGAAPEVTRKEVLTFLANIRVKAPMAPKAKSN